MGTISLVIPQIGQPDTTEDVKLQNALTTIQTVINGNIDSTNLSASAAIARSQMAGGFGNLAEAVVSSNTSVVDGRYYFVTAGTTTMTLPAPTGNATIGIFADAGQTGATPTTITASSGHIVGLGVPASSTSILLGTTSAYVVLLGDGANWNVVVGQQDTGWVNLGLASGWNGVGGFYVPAARKMGDRVWLRGQLQNSTGSGTATHSLPSGMTPTTSQLVTADAHFAGGDNSVVISTGGTLQANSSVPAAGFMGLDGSSYLLT